MIDLDKLERLHREATPAPWYCTRTIQEELGMEPFDWGTIMLTPREGKGFAPILAKMNMNFATEEEQSLERKRYYSGKDEKKVRDPGQPGRDAELIAVVRNALPDIIAHIRNQDASLASMKRKHDTALELYAEYHDVNCGLRNDLYAMKKAVEKLANIAVKLCSNYGNNDCSSCPFGSKTCKSITAEDWKNAALSGRKFQ